MSVVVQAVPFEVGNELEHEDDDGVGGEIGLDAVPGDGDEASDERGDVGAEGAEGDARENRVRQSRRLPHPT